MKKFTIAVITALLLLTACNQNELVVAPDNNVQQVTSEQNWLMRPVVDKQPLLLKSETTSKVINAANGGTINVSFLYFDFSSELWIKFCGGTIFFPQNAWDTNIYGAEKLISMTLDDETVTADFEPSMTFTNSPTLNLTFYGLEVSQEELESYEFVYLAPDGTYEAIDHIYLHTDPQNGCISILGAKIPHFSRFGYLN